MRLLAPIVLLGCAPFAQPQGFSLPSRETLYYNVEWRLITAGKARIDWSASPAPRSGYQLRMRLESIGMVSKLFKVEDDYSAEMSPALCIEASQLTALEGRRQRETKITFEHGKANYLERDLTQNTVVAAQEIDVPACLQDVAGGLYFLRTLALEPGQNTQVPVTDGKRSAMARVEAQQREDVRTPSGLYKTVRYEVYLFNNVLYRRPAHLYVWVSDDRARLPVQIRVRMQFTIGTITLQLEKHE
jgi:hypothetical protein